MPVLTGEDDLLEVLDFLLRREVVVHCMSEDGVQDLVFV